MLNLHKAAYKQSKLKNELRLQLELDVFCHDVNTALNTADVLVHHPGTTVQRHTHLQFVASDAPPAGTCHQLTGRNVSDGLNHQVDQVESSGTPRTNRFGLNFGVQILSVLFSESDSFAGNESDSLQKFTAALG